MARNRKMQMIVPLAADDVDLRDSRRVTKTLPEAVGALPAELNLRFKSDTPLFFADPSDPTIVIRKLRRKTSHGRFVGGKFVEIK
ncbi:hypothetical protein GTP81_02875 [Rugamonas sp. FT107W]|uniref:Uncharacterized protein n=1 Tax=Duganella vulcania TaxID=2692166 RepID=A0A845HAM4_9BURK|nr:hypothetical protein [Duganella vulcania]MYN15688.1 hypothetical protein [Duganella vulcania]